MYIIIFFNFTVQKWWLVVLWAGSMDLGWTGISAGWQGIDMYVSVAIAQHAQGGLKTFT